MTSRRWLRNGVTEMVQFRKRFQGTIWVSLMIFSEEFIYSDSDKENQDERGNVVFIMSNVDNYLVRSQIKIKSAISEGKKSKSILYDHGALPTPRQNDRYT